MGDIIIIGGGIAGLTAAIALLRQGKKVRLFDQAPEFGEVGAGISLSRPASRGLFSIGLREAIERQADVPVRAGAVDFSTGERGDSPNLMQKAAEEDDIPYFYQIHRADLHRILVNAAEQLDPELITLDRRLVDLEQDSDGITAIFADGSRERGAVLLGADGINSVVRELLFGKEEARFTGQVAYRFLVPVSEVEPYLHHGPSVKYAGGNRSLLRYIIRHGTLVNGVGFVPTDAWTGEGWSTPVPHDELMEKFAGANHDLHELLMRVPVEGTRKWALFDRDPLEQWTVGRATLLGDAAHPMLPFLGLGAAMGIEDAVVMGRTLGSEMNPVEALQAYENTRRERANHVLLSSREQGLIDQRGITAPTRAAQNAHLMTYDPSTAPIAA